MIRGARWAWTIVLFLGCGAGAPYRSVKFAEGKLQAVLGTFPNAKHALGLDCACEAVEREPASDYGWHSWPDKRVAPLTLKFHIAC